MLEHIQMSGLNCCFSVMETYQQVSFVRVFCWGDATQRKKKKQCLKNSRVDLHVRNTPQDWFKKQKQSKWWIQALK